MRIRSITYFFDPAHDSGATVFDTFRDHSNNLRRNLAAAGYQVQSVRLATTPFSLWLDLGDESKALQQVSELCRRAHSAGFDYISVGPCRMNDRAATSFIPAMLALSPMLFTGMHLVDAQGRISLADITDCAGLIKQITTIEANGFANLRFAALANVKPFTPFFPAAYGASGERTFSFAMECADVAQETFKQAEDIDAGCHTVCAIFTEHARRMEDLIEKTSSSVPIIFKGFDFSLAPYPEDWCSFGKALEALGVAQIGSAGSIAAAAILAGMLEAGTWKKSGFNGLMMPILEDSILAERSGAGLLSIYDVLQYSSLCGTGLDTVPLSGDIEEEKIAALLLDVAALAVRLNKPLTARLMPIPGKKAGDTIEFDFAFFAKGKVLDYPYSGIQKPLFAGEAIQIQPRR